MGQLACVQELLCSIYSGIFQCRIMQIQKQSAVLFKIPSRRQNADDTTCFASVDSMLSIKYIPSHTCFANNCFFFLTKIILYKFRFNLCKTLQQFIVKKKIFNKYYGRNSVLFLKNISN